LNTHPDCRSSVIGVLRLLSSPSQQVAYERRVPHVSVTVELLSLWFDDIYLPNSQAFRSCFSAEELSALAAFNQFYEKQSQLLLEPKNGVSDWLKEKNWQEIMQRASNLVEAFEP
jgi:hypothetical protein